MPPSSAILGVNFSNAFQSKPIDPSLAAGQIASLPVTCAKTFGYHDRNLAFIKAAHARKQLTLAVGTLNAELSDLARGITQPLVDAIGPFAEIVSWLCVGNEPLGSWYNHEYDRLLVAAVTNVHNALQRAGLKIGVTVPQNFEFMANSYPPSAGTIKPALQPIIAGTCEVMRRSGAPFMVNIYPFITRVQNRSSVPLEYCLFTAPPNQWVQDGAYTYKNIFDAMIDALHVALSKIGYGDLEIVVGECGWPTQGDQDATTANAQIFNQNMINHCKSGAGTPRNPGKPIRCFAFEMYDEDEKDIGPGPFERHWGIYSPTGEQKYQLIW
jgi:exo-beta-1,3-glucanase (GH17 family)